MVHSGQEFARSKVITKTVLNDPNWGTLDHNSYNKDDETNYINFKYSDMNPELVNYYKGLIQLRKDMEAFRRASVQHINFIHNPDSLLLAYELNYQNQNLIVSLNGNREKDNTITLPKGKWRILVDEENVHLGTKGRVVDSEVNIPASTGMVFQKYFDLN